MTFGQSNMSANVTDYELTVGSMIKLTLEVILMAFVCTVNVLTLITVCLNRNLWTVHNMYVISLAVADFLTSLSIPYQMVYNVPEILAVFDNNKYMCLCKYVILFIVISISILHMVLIAVDRWACITYPHKYERLATIPKAGILIVFVWISGILLGTVPLYANEWTRNTDCVFFKVLNPEYQIYVQGGFFIVTSVIIAACYGHMFRVAKRRTETLRRLTSTGYTLNKETQMAKFKRDWELVKMFSVIFVVFFLCSAPSFLFIIVTYTAGVPENVISFTTPLLLTNSGMNFVIYVVKNYQFRTALKATCLNCRTSVVAAT
ncbi:octopamine receptor beta-2R-like [Gigantopelta aegis]|uniref:octopamine receptor beta-2R-like n=1 Tax=Gigantopelta aegis TaxID=1735272 RepID=UPI001B889C9D|nr:octopamine receptor beta-2R-like [Gigantopelta aegis]